MKKLEQISKQELLDRTHRLVQLERKITLRLVDHLLEIDQRKLHSELGYGDLYEFCVKQFGMSEGSAYRRISAMRLLKDIPKVRPAILAGKLSISNASLLQGFLSKERTAGRFRKPEERQALIESTYGLSKRQCEKKLFTISPLSVPKERARVISGTEVELRIVIGHEAYEHLSELKARLAHRLPGASNSEIIEHVLKDALERARKAQGVDSPASQKPQILPAAAPNPRSTFQKQPSGVGPNYGQTSENQTSRPPAAVARTIWSNAKGRCEFIGSGGRRCESRYALEIDHILPVAHGGSHAPENLRVLCRAHNLQQAVEKLGPEVMKNFIPSLRTRTKQNASEHGPLAFPK